MRPLLALLTLLASLPLQASTWLDCREVDDAEARLACYDSAADAVRVQATAGTEATPAAPADVPTVATASPQPTVDPVQIFGREANTAKKMVQDVFGVEDINAIEAEVVTVKRTPHDKLVVVLNNKQIWQQLDNYRLTLKTGDEVRVETASFGSYRLLKTSGSRRIRVRRID